MKNLFAILVLAPLIVGATCAKDLKQDAKECAALVASNMRDAGIDQLEPAIHSALHLDWVSAVSQLSWLAARYGDEFITCLVAKLRVQYAAWLADPDAGTVLVPIPNGSAKIVTRADLARSLFNAENWVAGNRGTP